MRSVQIPFPGFYDSELSGYLDNVEEQFAEHGVETQESSRYYPDTWEPEELRLDSGDFAQIVYDCMDYGKAFNFLARRWVDYFALYCKNELEIDIPMTFEEMVSPREYNFTTDRVFVLISDENARKLYRLSRNEKHVRLAEMIKERCTSRSGFASFYSNDIDTWIRKPFEEWDHNELAILLAALLPSDRTIFNEVLDGMNDSSPTEFDDAFDRAMDWGKYKTMVDEKRDGMRAELGPDWKCPRHPDTHTKELFA